MIPDDDGYQWGVRWTDGSVTCKWNGATQQARATEFLTQVRIDFPGDGPHLRLVRRIGNGPWEEAPDLGIGPGVCILCGEMVTWEEAAFYMSARPAHPECGTRMALGGIGHLEDHQHWCLEVGDPNAGLSYRESARRVEQWLRDHGTEAIR